MVRLVDSGLLSVLFLGACTTVSVDRGPREMSFLQACKDATSDALVLNLAAHPDDEAARTLVYLRRKYGARTVTVYSTCGDGGQNAIGREIGPALAFLRTRETLAAARFTGTEVRWLRFADFGYSKTAAETFRNWGKADYLREIDKVVTAEVPDVIFTNHSPERGHGHHRASVLAIRELMDVKARGGWVVPVYQRTGRDARFDVKFAVGDIDPITGETYARQAYRGWRQHRTQGVIGPLSSTRLTADTWTLVQPDNASVRDPLAYLGSVFDEPAFQRLARVEEVDIAALRSRFAAFGGRHSRSAHVERARELLPQMHRFYRKIGEGPAAIRLRRRIDALQRIVMLGAGVTITAQVSQERLAPGSRGHIFITVDREGSVPPREVLVSLDNRRVTGRDGVVRVPFGPLENVPVGDVAPAWFHPVVSFDVDGVEINRQIGVRYTPVAEVSLEWARNVHMVPAGRVGGSIEVPIEITWNRDEAMDAALQLASSHGVVAKTADATVSLPARPAKAERVVRIELPEKALDKDVVVTSQLGPGRSDLLLRLVDANPPPTLGVGLIRGPDDSLELALKDLGIRYRNLEPAALEGVDFSQFTTLVLDIRAYHHRKDLKKHRDRILAWCAAGGRVVTFYHKPREWNASPSKPLLAPYDLMVGRQRVCEEDAAVTFIDPEHRLLTHPNRITAEDFAGWVQERGLNFPGKWAAEWQPILRMNDAGEKPLDGSLLYAKSGKGDYVYCSLALYRQLRRGHAGAARILVNLLAK